MRQVTLVKYVAEDGEEFDSEAPCLRYEQVSSLCNEIEMYYTEEHGKHAPSIDEVVEYIVDNFILSRITLEELLEDKQ